MRVTLAILVAILSSAVATPCSRIVLGFPNTHYEDIREVQAIALARVVEFTPIDELFDTVHLEITQVLAGEVDTIHIFTPGIEGPKSSASGGPCSDMNYRRGALHLLLLAKYPVDGWELASAEWSNKEISGPDDPWLQRVLRYIEIRRLNDYRAQVRALQELQLRAQSGMDPVRYPSALVRDIQKYLDRPHVEMDFEEIYQFYETSSDENFRSETLLLLAGRPEADHVFWELLFHPPKTSKLPIHRHFSRRIRQDRELAGQLIQTILIDGVEPDLLTGVLADAEGPHLAPDLLEVARRALPVKALDLCPYFARHPYPAALEFFRSITPEWKWAEEQFVCLASLGDRETLREAERHFESNALRRVHIDGLVASPLEEACNLRHRIIAEGTAAEVKLFFSPTARVEDLDWIAQTRSEPEIQKELTRLTTLLCLTEDGEKACERAVSLTTDPGPKNPR